MELIFAFKASHFILAYALDLMTGDPEWMPHPVRWIGSLIDGAEKRLYRRTTPRELRLLGVAFWLVVAGGTALATCAALYLAYRIHSLVGHLLMVWVAYSTLATRCLHEESRKVFDALRTGDIREARKCLSMLVSRDTECIEEKDVIRALIETVAENISDGIVAPLFYLALGGPVAAMTYKAVNTMDSMVGYTNARYKDFGWFAARADDVANWIPSRLSALMIALAAACLRYDWKQALRVTRRDARKMKSPNAGYPESASAGALGIQLGGRNFYFGRPVEKPVLGDAVNPLEIDTYTRMIRLLYASSILSFLFALGLRALCITRL